MLRDYKKIIIIVIMAFVLMAVFTACKPEPTPSPTNTPKKMTPIEGVQKVLEAIEASAKRGNSSDIIFLDITAKYINDNTTYDIIFKANIEPSGAEERNNENKIYFEVRNSSAVYLGIYYFNDNLYLNLPVDKGATFEKFFITNLKLSDIISKINIEEVSGKKAVRTLIASFMDSVDYSEKDVEEITFGLNLKKAAEAVFSYIINEYPTVKIDDLLGIFGHTYESFLYSLNDYDNAQITFKIDDGLFSGVSYTDGIDSSFAITSFNMSSGAGNFTIPIDPGKFTEYSPLNIDLSGSLKLEIKGGEYVNPIAGIDVSSDLDDALYEFDFRVRSKINLLAPDKNMLLVELNLPDKFKISFYYDGATRNLYADLSEINMGKVMMSADRLAELINSLAEELPEEPDGEDEKAKFEYDVSSVLSLIGIVAPGVKLDADSLEIVFDEDRFRALFAAFGINLPLDIKEAGAAVERSGYSVNSMRAWVEFGGLKLIFETEDVTVGPNPVIPVPSGLGSYTNVANVEVFTISMDGSLELVTAQRDTLTFIEGLLSSVTGDEIEILPQYPPSGNTVKYEVRICVNADDGDLQSLTLNLSDTAGKFLVGAYYLQSENKIFITREVFDGSNFVHEVTSYTPSFDIKELLKLVTGKASETPPTAPDLITISNTLNSLTVKFNYNAFYTFVDYIANSLFDSNELNRDYVFDDISFTIGEGFSGTVTFSNNTRITVNADALSLSYNAVSIIGIAEYPNYPDVTPVINVPSVFLDNSMPKALTLKFSDGSQKKYKTDKWTYDLNGFVNTQGGTVKAYTEILGQRFNINLNVIGTNISSLDINELNTGFIIDKNDFSVDPIKQIQSINKIKLTFQTSNFVYKDLYWDLSTLKDVNTNGEYLIQGIIYDFFGREKRLPTENSYYKVTIKGTDILSHNLDRVLESYEGIDPTMISNYPELAVLTPEGLITTDPSAEGDIVRLEWNLASIISAFAQPNFNAYQQGLDVDVSVNIPNTLGTERIYKVNVKIKPAVMTGIDFTGLLLGNGKAVDEMLNTSASASGISWDKDNNKLVINPLRIRVMNESVLPASVIMKTAGGQFEFKGLKWEFLPLTILNSGGTYDNILKLIIGDNIGGYQETFVTVEVVAITINDFELMTQGEDILVTQDLDTLYKRYLIDNPYDYSLPRKTKVFTSIGEFILTTAWSFPTFDTSTLFNGGSYEGTYQAGSQELKVRIDAEPAVAVMSGLTFRPEDTSIHFDEAKGLVFNPYTSEDFTDIRIYPLTGYAKFTNGEGVERYLEVPIKWNISAITSLYSGSNPNMYLGKRITVTAMTDYSGCGMQQFNVDVYIEEAIIEKDKVIFSTDNPVKVLDMSIFGVDGGKLTFIDPRLTPSYPETIRVSYAGATLPSRIIHMNPEDVAVNWNLDSVLSAYRAATIISGVSGKYDIIGTVGTLRGGYQTVTMQVNILSSQLTDILFTNIPLQPDGYPAFVYDKTAGQGYIATFEYDPYESNVKDGISYPSAMTFKLDIGGSVHSFNMPIEWNLANVAGIKPYLGGFFTVEARLPLSDTGYVPVPVRISVKEKKVDTLNGEGLFNIFIDPLDKTPFGRRNSTSKEVRQTVEVTFTGDDSVMTLNLVYNRENILIDFGGNLYLIDAFVGNDFGGYQPIGMDGKIQLAIVQREITDVFTDDNDNLELYHREEIEVLDEYGNLLYKEINETNPSILYYESRPDTLLFRFTGIPDPVSVPLRKEDTTGLCFEWTDIDLTHAQVKIYNIIPAFMEDGEDKVFIGNPYVSLDVVKLIDVKDSLITKGTYGVEYYGDVVDIVSELNSLGRINNASLGIDEEYLRYVISYGGEIIAPENVENSGVYTLRIYVKGHTVYGGYDEVEYTIHKRNITENISIWREDIQKNITGQDLTESIQYNGNAIEYSAKALPYSYTIDIIYPEGTPPVNVGTYTIEVQVNPLHPNESCDITITLTITKVYLDESSPDVNMLCPPAIVYGTSEFDIELSSYGVELQNFTFKFYEEIDCANLIEDISLVNVGTYYVKVDYIGENYDINAVRSFNVIPATIDPSDINFTASNMSSGETGPQLTLKVFDNIYDLSGIVPSYYADPDCTTPVNIETASEGEYYVRIAIEIDNYQPINPVASFFKEA